MPYCFKTNNLVFSVTLLLLSIIIINMFNFAKQYYLGLFILKQTFLNCIIIKIIIIIAYYHFKLLLFFS